MKKKKPGVTLGTGSLKDVLTMSNALKTLPNTLKTLPKALMTL